MLYILLPKLRCYLNTALSGINIVPIRYRDTPASTLPVDTPPFSSTELALCHRHVTRQFIKSMQLQGHVTANHLLHLQFACSLSVTAGAMINFHTIVYHCIYGLLYGLLYNCIYGFLSGPW